jgi:tetratricopeptide (TPR) repeat protein
MTVLTSPRASWLEWRYWPYLIIGLATLLRLAHIFNSRTSPTFWAPAVGPAWYDQAALNILSGDWGVFPLFRAPVYPLLLAGIYGIFGHDLVAARLLNVVLQSATIWVIFLVGRSYFSPAVAIIASALFALNGMAIFYSAELLSVSAEMLMATVGMWAIFHLTKELSIKSIAICGLTWGLAAITRPNFLVLFPVALAVIWLIDSYRNRFVHVAIFVIAAALPMLPITTANWVKGREFVLIATQGGVNFWIGNNPESTGILSVLPGYGNTWQMEDAENAAEREVGHPLRPGALSNYYFHKGWKFLRDNPSAGLRLMIRKTLLFFNHFEISNNKHIAYFAAKSPWLPPLIGLDFGVLLPLSILGFYLFRKTPYSNILLVSLLIYAVSVILYFITTRFRMPAVPWLCLMSAAALAWIIEQLRARITITKLWPVLLLIPGTALAYLDIWHLGEAPVGWARYMEGNAYLHLNALDSARACFLDAVNSGEASAKGYLNLGVIEYRQEHYHEARNYYQLSLNCDSLSPEAWNNLGTVLESLRDTSGAVHAYQKALLCKPTAPDPKHNLAAVYFHLGISALKNGDDQNAIKYLEQTLLLEPTAIVHYDIAVAYGRQEQPDRALDELNRSLQMDPNLAVAQQLKAKLRSQTATSSADDATP